MLQWGLIWRLAMRDKLPDIMPSSVHIQMLRITQSQGINNFKPDETSQKSGCGKTKENANQAANLA